MEKEGQVSHEQQVTMEEFREYKVGSREVPIEELISNFEFSDMTELAHYQESTPAIELINAPFSEMFVATYGQEAVTLAENISTYEDDLEDDLVSDKVIEQLMLLRKGQPNNKDIAHTIRARRSTLVAILGIMNKQPCDVNQIKKNSNTAPSTSDTPTASGLSEAS